MLNFHRNILSLTSTLFPSKEPTTAFFRMVGEKRKDPTSGAKVTDELSNRFDLVAGVLVDLRIRSDVERDLDVQKPTAGVVLVEVMREEWNGCGDCVLGAQGKMDDGEWCGCQDGVGRQLILAVEP